MARRNIIRIISILTMTVVAYFVGFVPDSAMMSTLFTVLSVFISIGLSIIISFDLSKVKNDFIFKKVQANLKRVKDNFIWYFAVIIVIYISYPRISGLCKTQFFNIGGIEFVVDFHALFNDFVFSLLVFGVLYYLYNFSSLQSLKDEITAELRKS